MKINQIVESKESLKTYLSLHSDSNPENFERRLKIAKEDFLKNVIDSTEFHKTLDHLSDKIEDLIFSSTFENIQDDPEIDELLDEYYYVDQSIIQARKLTEK